MKRFTHDNEFKKKTPSVIELHRKFQFIIWLQLTGLFVFHGSNSFFFKAEAEKCTKDTRSQLFSLENLMNCNIAP